MLVVNVHLRDSRIGRAWIAVRDDEAAAASVGIPVARTKLLAYATGAAIGGDLGRLPRVLPGRRQRRPVRVLVLDLHHRDGRARRRSGRSGASSSARSSSRSSTTTCCPIVFFDLPSRVGLDFDLSAISSGIYGVLLVLAVLLGPAGFRGAATTQTAPSLGYPGDRSARAPQSTSFQNESFRLILPSVNSNRSHPRTSIDSPVTWVPRIVHSDTPRSPDVQWRGSPYSMSGIPSNRAWNPFRTCSLPTNRCPPGAGPRGVSKTQSSVKNGHDRVDVVSVERVEQRLELRRRLCARHGSPPEERDERRASGGSTQRRRYSPRRR